MQFLTIWDDILTAVVNAIRTLFMVLCDLVYRLIVITYDVFNRIGTAAILDNSTVSEIYRKVGLLIGLFMVFRLGWSFVLYVINPDLIADKKSGVGNIVKKVLIVMVLLGTTPFLFREAFQLQNVLNKQNIIGRIVSGKSEILDEPGQNLAWYAFSSFYRLDDSLQGMRKKDNTNVNLLYECPVYNNETGGLLKEEFINNNSFQYAYECLNNTVDVLDNKLESQEIDRNYERRYVINFDGHGIICLLTGALILWTVLMYTIQLGVRLLQLAYLQLIAPIPIMLYLDPKNDDSLIKWSKQCLTTFLDFFIRTAVMYFIVFIIQLLIDNDSPFMDSFSDIRGFIGDSYINIIMIIALLIFAKRVPKLLQEVFPALKNAASLDFGLKPPKEAMQVGGLIAGATTAGAIGLIGGGLRGGLGGIFKGGYQGFKGTKLKDVASARAATNLRNRQIREDDNTTFAGRTEARLRNAFGFNTIPAKIDKQIKQIDENDIKPLEDQIKNIKENNIRPIEDQIKVFNDQKRAIDNDPTMKLKQKNDNVIGYYKTMRDEAEKELLKKDSDLIGWKNRIDYLQSHYGEIDSLTGTKIDGSLIEANKSHYETELKSKIETWVDANKNNNEIVKSAMAQTALELGLNVGDIDSYGDINTRYEDAKTSNNNIATDIAKLRDKKVKIDRQIEQANMQIDVFNRDIESKNRQIEGHNKRKEQLEKNKKRPQADLDAINKK